MLQSQVNQPKNPPMWRRLLGKIRSGLSRIANFFINLIKKITEPRQTESVVPTYQTKSIALTQVPTQAPTQALTQIPTQAPTQIPTQVPTQAPTYNVSVVIPNRREGTFDGGPLPLWSNGRRDTRDPFKALSEECLTRLGIDITDFPHMDTDRRFGRWEEYSIEYDQFESEELGGNIAISGFRGTGKPFFSYVYEVEGTNQKRIITLTESIKGGSLVRICGEGNKVYGGTVHIDEALAELKAANLVSREALRSELHTVGHLKSADLENLVVDYVLGEDPKKKKPRS